VLLSTAQRWMQSLDYRWTKDPSGQFVDGHECTDIVEYRQNKFLPQFAELEMYARRWDADGQEVINNSEPCPRPRRTVFWYHDESMFYAHDRHHTRWVRLSEKAKPRQKGEGASLMVADF
ncbi:hypothetical protein BXZ70DRAFT_877330, partial [Cristinia sonorae]